MVDIGTVLIETERLILRRFDICDAEKMYKNWASDDRVTKFLPWETHKSLEITKNSIQSWVNSYNEENYYNWAITLKNDNEVIGSIGAFFRSFRDDIVEIGYCSGYEFWNLGYMAEAVKAVVHFLFFDVKINRIEAHHVIYNINSGKVLKSSGFSQEGILKEKFKSAQTYDDVILWAITKNQFINQYIPENREFLDLSKIEMKNFGIYFECINFEPEDKKRNYIKTYSFLIKDINKNLKIGEISLRLGFNDILYYGGHVGYTVYEQFRNLNVATNACKILLNLIEIHGFKKIFITNSYTNIASRKVCEKIGAKLVRIAKLPEWHEMYLEGQRFTSIYELNIKKRNCQELI